MGDVIAFHGCRPPVGITDEALGFEVGLMRDNLGIPADSNKVLIKPMVDGYEPYIYPNGTVQLGKQGLEDFERTFDFIEDLDTTKLLVVYSVVKYGLSQRRRSDTAFHDDLGEVARQLMPKLPQKLHADNVHRAEDIVIGRLGVMCATARSAVGFRIPEARRKLPGQLISAAEQKRPIDPEYKAERTGVMRHFRLALDGSQNELISKLLKPVRPK